MRRGEGSYRGGGRDERRREGIEEGEAGERDEND